MNISEAFNCISSIAAKHSKIKKVVIHSHSSGSSSTNFLYRKFCEILNNIFKRILYKNGDIYLACSKKAGMWIFPKKIVESDKFRIIYNTIDFKKYQFDRSKRNDIRNKMGWNDKIVIGHVGNFLYVKNHKFIIEFFYELSKVDERYKLALIGKGRLLEEIKEQVIKLKIEEKVDFIGVVDNVNEWMLGMDIFVLPSFFEGLPIAGIEAQASGLPSLFSNNISEEILISENSTQLKIGKHTDWVNKINELSKNKREKAKLLENAQKYNSSNTVEQFDIIIN